MPREARTGLPPWTTAELDAPPRRNWRQLLGPGIVMAGASLGAGEWLIGPAITARYGGALLWITVLTLLAQYIYNVEASRYTLATGEGIMTGKLRLKPGSRFWTFTYLAVDFWTMLPFQLSAVAVTGAAIILGRIPDPASETGLMRQVTYVLLLLVPLPLIFGGTIYRLLKGLVMVKVFFVLGLLLVLALALSSWRSLAEVALGFLQFGSLPAANGQVVNVFGALWRGEGFPALDTESMKLFTTLAGIAGVGGLTQTSICAYTREQGWGMGKKVGAIASMVGGEPVALAHSGATFVPTPPALARWRGWLRMVHLDQWQVWLPASLIGLALPALISIEVLPRGTTADRWVLASMMAGGVETRVGGGLGHLLWHLMLICGFLVLFPVTITTVDGFLRRWVDVVWTSSGTLRRIDPRQVLRVYYGFLAGYVVMSAAFLAFASPLWLVIVAANVNNFALGLSCFHTLAVNTRLLPGELRPGFGSRLALGTAGFYFLSLAAITVWIIT
ncbi:MAG: Nramp family divalent metal transporter [Opitutaceae bacterium]|nr:Nramp family divalent metal transporter [Opitutaceae bacterium]